MMDSISSIRPRIIFWIVFATFAATVGWMSYHHLFSRGYLRPALVLRDEILDLGTISAGRPVEAEFSITNEGFRPLRIESIRSDCTGCVDVISFPQTPISRKETVKVRIALKTESLSPGLMRKSLMITSNDPLRPLYPMMIDAVVEQGD
jgi:hypothetical protein